MLQHGMPQVIHCIFRSPHWRTTFDGIALGCFAISGPWRCVEPACHTISHVALPKHCCCFLLCGWPSTLSELLLLSYHHYHYYYYYYYIIATINITTITITTRPHDHRELTIRCCSQAWGSDLGQQRHHGQSESDSAQPWWAQPWTYRRRALHRHSGVTAWRANQSWQNQCSQSSIIFPVFSALKSIGCTLGSGKGVQLSRKMALFCAETYVVSRKFSLFRFLCTPWGSSHNWLKTLWKSFTCCERKVYHCNIKKQPGPGKKSS